MLKELFTVCLHCGTRLPSTGRVCPRCRTPRPFGGCIQTGRIILGIGTLVVGVALGLHDIFVRSKDEKAAGATPTEVWRAEPLEPSTPSDDRDAKASWFAVLTAYDDTT